MPGLFLLRLHLRTFLGVSFLLSLLACRHPSVKVTPPAAPSPEDVWKADMERRHDGYAAKPLFGVHEISLKPAAGFVQVSLAEKSHHDKGLESAVLYIAESPLIDSRWVRGAYLRPLTPPEIPTVGLEWTEDGRRKFKEISTAHTNQKVALMLRDRLVSTPVIKEPIDSPHFEFSVPSAKSFVECWGGGNECRDVEHYWPPSLKEIDALLREFNPPVDSMALTNLLNRCKQGRIQSCILIGTESLRGRDLPFDPALAVEELRVACQLGDGGSCFGAYEALGSWLKGEKEFQGLLRRGCDAAHLPSCQALAKILVEIRPSSTGLMAEAESLFRRSCDGRLGESCRELALLIYDKEGRRVTPRLLALAEKACQYGSWLSCENLGQFALYSEPPNPDAALKWFNTADAVCALVRERSAPCESGKSLLQRRLKAMADSRWERQLDSQSRQAVFASLNRMWAGALGYYEFDQAEGRKVGPKRFPGGAESHLTADCCKSPAACAGEPMWTHEEPWMSLHFSPPDRSEHLRFDFRSAGMERSAQFVAVVAVDAKCTGHPTYVWRRGHIDANGEVAGEYTPSGGESPPELTATTAK